MGLERGGSVLFQGLLQSLTVPLHVYLRLSPEKPFPSLFPPRIPKISSLLLETEFGHQEISVEAFSVELPIENQRLLGPEQARLGFHFRASVALCLSSLTS